MLKTEQINVFWELARQRSAEGEVLRRRIAAVGAVAGGFCGLLLAIGLGMVVLVLVAAIVVSVAVAALVPLWPRLRTFGGNGITCVRDRSRAAHAELVPRWRKVASAACARGNALAHAALAFGRRIGRDIAQAGRAA